MFTTIREHSEKRKNSSTNLTPLIGSQNEKK